MKRRLITTLLVSLTLCPRLMSAQGLVKSSEQKTLQEVLKVIRNPNASYEAKEAASDRASHLSPAALKMVERAMFVQGMPEIAQEGFNSMFSAPISAGDLSDNWKFVQDNITRVHPQTQAHVVYQLVAAIGIQTRDREIIYHAIARKIAQQYTSGGRSLNIKTSEALSRASLLLALSPLYDSIDQALILKAARISRFFSPLALALSYRHLLNKPILQQLKKNNPGVFPQNYALQIASATVDNGARTKFISIVRAITTKKYIAPPGSIDLQPAEDAHYINMLRFVDFSEKRSLIVAASQSGAAAIKHAAFLVAAEEYPEIVIGNASVQSAFIYKDNYNSLMTYLALRHPQYIKKVKGEIGARLFDQTSKKLREQGIRSNYENTGGFMGI